MHCSICKHITEMREALKPCATCGARDCERCGALADFRRVDRYCANCDAGSLHGEIHFDGAPGGLATVTAQVGAVTDAHTQDARGVTMLDPDTEDKLRIVLATVMSLDPLDLLLVRHVFQRRPLAKFRETAREVRDRLNGYDLRDVDERGVAVGSFKANVSNWGHRIVSKVPALSDVFAAVKAETATRREVTRRGVVVS